MKIREKLLLSILAAVLAIVVGLSWLSSTTSRRLLVGEIKQSAEFMLKSYSSTVENRLAALEDIVHTTANAMEDLDPLTEEGVKAFIKANIQINPIIFGQTIAFEPGLFPGKEGQFAPYYHRGAGGPVEVDLATPSYNYPEQSWFLIPRETQRPLWSEPYFDEGGGNVAMVTYSFPFSRDMKPLGVATIDISLKDLTDEIAKIKIGRSGFAFLVSRKGIFLTMRGREWTLKRTIADVADELNSSDLKVLGQRMTAGETGFLSLMDPLLERRAWYAFGSIPATGWSLCLVLPEDEMLAEVFALQRRLIVIAIVGIALVVLSIAFISERISRPIGQLAEVARRIAGGDLSTRLKVRRGRDEVAVLSRAFSEMQDSLERTLENLQEEKELFSASFSQMSDGLVILDTNLSAIQHNRSAEQLLGLPAEESVLEHLLSRFDSRPPLDRLADVSRGPPSFELVRKPDAQVPALHLLMVSTPIRDREGEIQNFVLLVRDVTELMREELSKKDFLSTISHKLRTPVAVLQSNVYLIKEGLLGPLNEKQQKNADTMAGQVAKLQALIEQLIGFVALEQCGPSRQREEIPLAPFFEELIAETVQRFPEKHPTVQFIPAEEAETISFGRDCLRMLFGELIQNGLKFNTSDPATVTVSMAALPEALVFAVADNGVGIPPEEYDKIFEKFYQSEKDFTGNVEGIGLGLPTVKKIVESYGGTIEVSSRAGEGSTFTVRIPRTGATGATGNGANEK